MSSVKLRSGRVVRALRVVLILVGGLVGASAAFLFDVGAKPCLDVRVGTAAACALPQPSHWAVLLCAALGAAVPLAAMRFDGRRRRG